MSISHLLNLISNKENEDDNRDDRIAIATIYTGDNQPNTNLGKVGDIYLDRLNNDCYIKSKKSWDLNGNISEYIGPQGNTGPQGYQGIKGDKGDKGDKGESGLLGPTGIQGLRSKDFLDLI
jgi:hypothetical protein